MRRVVDLRQPVEVQVRVNLRRRKVGVTEQLLHGAQIAALLEQMRRERMPQPMRMQSAGQPSLARPMPQPLLDAAMGQPLTVAADEERALAGVDEQCALLLPAL